MGRVLVLGSLNVDLVTRVERHPKPGETVLGLSEGRFAGGKGGNQAMAARRAGAEVAMFAAVGDDEAGRAYVARLEQAGVEARVRVCDEQPTGSAIVTVDDHGENSIVVVPGANHLLIDVELELGPGDVLLCSLEVPTETVVRAGRTAAAQGARVVINLAPYAALPYDVIALADPVVVNESEMRMLADSDLLPGSLLVTFGAAGARWGDEQADGIRLPENEVVDTTGAGDTFCGALAAALADGADRATALAAANAAGAKAVTWSGAQPDAAL